MNYNKGIPQNISDEKVVRLWSDFPRTEPFLQAMRAHGATKIESIRALRQVAGMSLENAKEAVHFSPTWADRREADEHFHNEVKSALESEYTSRIPA